jgi:hypothetical protein
VIARTRKPAKRLIGFDGASDEFRDDDGSAFMGDVSDGRYGFKKKAVNRPVD